MTISDIIRHLETLCPLSLQEDYDNCGLLMGDPGLNAEKALLCLDLTEAVMEEAIRHHCNLVISHHPFIFRGLKKLTQEQPETRLITLAIRHNIAVYAIHTNLDNTLHGLNGFIFSKLGISNHRILRRRTGDYAKLVTFCPEAHTVKVRDALFSAGAGTIGNYDSCSFNADGEGTFRASSRANPFVGERNMLHIEKETRVEVVFPRYLEKRVVTALVDAHPYEEVAYDILELHNTNSMAGAGLIGELNFAMEPAQFLEFVKNILEVPCIRHTKLLQAKIKTVAVCSGSGSFLIRDAARCGADAYLTADLKYHDFFVPSKTMLLADIGHYESEHWVKEWLYDALIEKFPNFAFLISEVNTNPVHYL